MPARPEKRFPIRLLHRAEAWALTGTVPAARDPETGFLPRRYNMTVPGEKGAPADIRGFMLRDLPEAGRILKDRISGGHSISDKTGRRTQ